MTNSIMSNPSYRSVADNNEIEVIKSILGKVSCRLIVFAYNMRVNEETRNLASLCESTMEGGFVENPD